MLISDIKILNTIQRSIDEKLSAFLSPDETYVALLDIPTHNNIGDTLIWQGELETLDRIGKKVIFTTDYGRFNQESINRLPLHVPLLIHGGGNFGDLWEVHQELRERIIEANPHRKIICLPQTIYFQDSKKAERAEKVFSSHPNVVVLARDHLSLERARKYMPSVEVSFCPDLALGCAPISNRVKPEVTLFLSRKDKEKKIMAIGEQTEHSVITDWRFGWLNSLYNLLLMLPLTLYKRSNQHLRRLLDQPIQFIYTEIRKNKIRASVTFFSRSRNVVTDRLHAQVLATLMGIPSLLFENNYGKMGPIYYDYLHLFSTSHFVDATSISEVNIAVRQFLTTQVNQ